MPAGIPTGAMCVQRFDDSLNSAIHITYRISLRSSSMPEPRDPLLKVLIDLLKNCPKRHNPELRGLASAMLLRGGDSPAGHKKGGFRPPLGHHAEAVHKRGVGSRLGVAQHASLLMILPQVHLRKPCYDFYFL